jgi:hypothetical protein
METKDSTGPVCSLSREELEERRQALIPGLIKRADQVNDLVDGLRLHFVNQPGLLAELAGVIEQERVCCGFLRFRVSVEPGGGPMSFEVTGPPGTRRMLRAL